MFGTTRLTLWVNTKHWLATQGKVMGIPLLAGCLITPLLTSEAHAQQRHSQSPQTKHSSFQHASHRATAHLTRSGHIATHKHVAQNHPSASSLVASDVDYRPVFQRIGRQYDVDWRLLAAIGYQESKWQANARGSGNVAGVMMLTGNTARHFGVTNRYSAEQSIAGGARYLQHIDQALPDSIHEPDRTWMMLVAYNRGTGYLEQIRHRISVSGGNPDSWPTMSHYLQNHAAHRRSIAYVEDVRRHYDALLASSSSRHDRKVASR